MDDTRVRAVAFYSADVRADLTRRIKDIYRPLSPAERCDIRARENREGSPYSDRDMLLDHVDTLTAENADLKARLEALEAVCLELIAERDRAVAALERLQQPSLWAESA